MHQQHRNSQKRYYEENLIYFVVTKTFRNFSYFREPIFCELFLEELKLCKKLKKFKLYGFCVIYDHLNLLIHPGDEFNISKVMFSIKKQFSHNANRIMGYNELFHSEGERNSEQNPESYPEGEQTLVRLQDRIRDFETSKQQVTVNDLINNHHKIVCDFRDQFVKKYGCNQTVIPKFKWQKSFYDHIIRNIKDFKYHYNYTVYNFLKHKLPESWKYTSLSCGGLVEGIEL